MPLFACAILTVAPKQNSQTLTLYPMTVEATDHWQARGKVWEVVRHTNLNGCNEVFVEVNTLEDNVIRDPATVVIKDRTPQG